MCETMSTTSEHDSNVVFGFVQMEGKILNIINLYRFNKAEEELMVVYDQRFKMCFT